MDASDPRQTSGNDNYSILRIKRKRTDAALPLDALLIDEAEPRALKKRKSLAAPQLHASSRNAADGGSSSRGIFRFAETVAFDSFDTEDKKRELRDRIAAAAQLPPPPIVDSPSLAPGPPAFSPPPASATRYTVQRQLPSSFLPTSASASTSQIYDAVAQTAPVGLIPVAGESAQEKGDRDELDKEIMDHFGPMLNEYLTLQPPVVQSARTPLPASKPRARPNLAPPLPPILPSSAILTDQEDDYVYDVYYRDPRPVPVDLAALEGRRVGQLAGWEDDTASGALVDDGDDDSEEEDEADQDSNEENDYRNDYPDTDSGSECDGAQDSNDGWDDSD